MSKIINTLQEQASLCVKCGLCLPYCPSYAVDNTEGESPRGRIALIDAALSDKTTISPKLSKHLDACLQCGACERVCPTKVPYIELYKKAHIVQPALACAHKPFTVKLILAIFRKNWLKQLFFFSIACANKLGLLFLLDKIRFFSLFKLETAASLLVTVQFPTRFKSFYPAKGTGKEKVGLFIGCLTPHTEKEVILSAIKLLNALGTDVYLPKQTCCGALYTQCGEHKQALYQQKQNKNAFAKLDLNAIITLETGCFSEVAHTQHTPVADISQYIINHPNFGKLSFTALNETVSILVPCTQKLSLQADLSETLLKRIPKLSLTTLKNDYCCGAAGLYRLKYPEKSDWLQENLLKQLPKNGKIASGNIGCRQSLQKKLKKRMIHPIVLLAGQLSLR